ncbi:MAG: ATP-binding cassette domain-containing protein [Gammaproteobacteria bacterium]|nr:ATP-binding cassette domain-containing protein [Gammaproteobacteria bacterium]
MPENTVLIDAQGISLKYADKQILQNISLSIHAGEIVTIVGPNGAGKTTLIRALLGLQTIDQGKLYKKNKLRIGYVPQKIRLDPVLPLTIKRFLTLTANYAMNQIEQVLLETGVKSSPETSIYHLSGGEFQRLMLARALLAEPELLVLDEPVQNVDYLGEAELYRLISDLRKRYQCAVLMISHDLHVVMASTDRVICLDHHICCQGEPCDVSLHPEYVRLFGSSKTLSIYNHHHDHSHEVDGSIQEHKH